MQVYIVIYENASRGNTHTIVGEVFASIDDAIFEVDLCNKKHPGCAYYMIRDVYPDSKTVDED